MIKLELDGDNNLTEKSKTLLITYINILFPELSEQYAISDNWSYISDGYYISTSEVTEIGKISAYAYTDNDMSVISAKWSLEKDGTLISESETLSPSPLQELEIKTAITKPAKPEYNSAIPDDILSHAIFDELDWESETVMPGSFTNRNEFTNFMNNLAIAMETSIMDFCNSVGQDDLYIEVPSQGGISVHLYKQNGSIIWASPDPEENDKFFIDLPYSEQVAILDRIMDILEYEL